MKAQNKNCALILIDVQKGFLDFSYWGKINNHHIVKNIEVLLKLYRELQYPIIHIQHLSTEETSPLRPGQEGSEFIESCAPRLGERIFQKSVNSAFIGTNLEAHLRTQNIESVVLAGFTSDHCVSTTARMASNLGFITSIVADCTATFERRGLDSIFPAELVHDVSLASLNNEFATVFRTITLFRLGM
ncbi:MAG TPA: cysteine hydrolase family protein [Bdellovibrio sp.]|nr:cysteine hydrolase family protein [Bdellovibrio sp.]